MLYSLSKSFTSTAVGLAVAERRLTVNDRVISFFPEDLPANVSANLAALRVRDLLSMSVGHEQDSTGSLWDTSNWVRQFFSLPIAYDPGTRFLYNSGATYMLSAIIQQLTKQKLVDYLEPRLFAPLGITGASWEQCPRGISTGGWGLKVKTEALARFAQLYMQRGRWGSKQLLPESWIEEATSFKIQQPSPDLEKAKRDSDWHQGYCYQFWRCRHNAFRGDGAFGQFAVVMPEQDAVVIITSESPDMQGELNLVWEHLLPAIHPAPLRGDRNAQSELESCLGHLTISPPSGTDASSSVASSLGKTFQVEPGDHGFKSLSLRFDKGNYVFAVANAQGEHHVTCGAGKWVDGLTDMPGMPPKLTRGDLGPVHKVAGAAAWKDPHTLEMRWQFFETPHHQLVTLKFEGDACQVDFQDSLSRLGGRRSSQPALKGTLKAS
jgi:hypothetical protein